MAVAMGGGGSNNLDGTGLIPWMLATVRSPFQAHRGALESTIRAQGSTRTQGLENVSA